MKKGPDGRTLKTPADLLIDEFFERVLEDIPRMLPAVSIYAVAPAAARFSYDTDYRRLLRDRILARLAE